MQRHSLTHQHDKKDSKRCCGALLLCRVLRSTWVCLQSISAPFSTDLWLCFGADVMDLSTVWQWHHTVNHGSAHKGTALWLHVIRLALIENSSTTTQRTHTQHSTSYLHMHRHTYTYMYTVLCVRAWTHTESENPSFVFLFLIEFWHSLPWI